MARSIKMDSEGWFDRLRSRGAGAPVKAVVQDHSASAFAREREKAADQGTHPHDGASLAAPDYADLFEHAPVGYMVLDESGRIARINQTGAAMLGWAASWLGGKPFSRWVVDNDKPLFHAHLCTLRDCDGCVHEELRIKNHQGRVVSLRVESAPAASTATHNRDYRCILIDISGEQQSARKLRRLHSQLTHVARVNTVGELASSLAHELNQPLGTVVLNCDAALRLLEGGAEREYEFAQALNQAREAASFASEVVRHLRGFLSKDGDLQTVCDIRTLVQDVSMLIRAEARDNDIELKVDIDQHLAPLRVDSVQIEQVLLNLAHNSIEAMQENGSGPDSVTIRVRAEPPNRIRVSVEDTGPGLDADQLKRIFTPFYTTKSDGMGMGLSISRTIVEAHGGKMWADAASASGATIHMTLPTIDVEPHAD